MIRHVFKLVWNRKRSTGLILVEIFICFLVLCGLMTAALQLSTRWRQSLGFDIENVWSVEIQGVGHRLLGNELTDQQRRVGEILRAVQGLPGVKAAALATNTPYKNSMWAQGTWIDGRSVHFLWCLTSPGLLDVLRLELVEGRWLEDSDFALGYEPVVISEGFARDLFKGADPIGQDVPTFDREGKRTEPESEAEIQRVVGVVHDYRRKGEFQPTEYAMFLLADLQGDEMGPEELLVRVHAGTTAGFEETLIRTMQEIAPHWSFDSRLLEAQRSEMLRDFLVPYLVTGVVALFLILMVGLGLVGVLWLSVTRRTSELGLRRALGASGGAVQRQVLGELWALTALAVGIGALIFLQLPLFGANFGAGWPVFLGGTLLAALVLYAFVTACGLYPTWLATRIQPAAALQYE